MAVLLAALVLAGCAADASDDAGESDRQPVGEAGFPRSTVFDYQLGGAYTPPSQVGLVVRDRRAAPAAGIYSVCYVNAFQTQPGEQSSWPDEALLRDAEGPVIDADWPDEILLDTSTPERRELILETVVPWVQGCATDGYQGVEFDNLDSFTRSDGALSFDGNLALATDLAQVAHDAGLAVGQKNSAEYTSELREQAGFDFAVAEECAAYEECTAYSSVYGDAVIDIEYTDTLPRSFEEMCADSDSPTSMILRDRELATADEPSYVYETCRTG